MKKQGRADRDVTESGHPNPKSKAVSVDHVANLGLRQVRTVPTELYKGRGFQAPAMKTREYNKGSQGKR